MVAAGDRHWSESMSGAYQRWLVPAVFAPFARELAQRVARHRCRRVLELAAGTGALTGELAAAGGLVLATDLNPAMVAAGRQAVPQARWAVADAAGLPLDGGRFDVVAWQFGVMFLADRRAGLAEAARVLRPGGRLLFSTWAGLAAHGLEATVTEALARVFPVDTPDFLAAVPHGYADPEVIVADLRAAGYGDATVEPVTLGARAGSAAEVAAGYCLGTPLRAALEARADLTAATAAVAEELTRRLGTGPVAARMTAYLVDAVPLRR